MTLIDYIAGIWLLFCAVGLITSILALNAAIGDRAWLRDSGFNGGRRSVADASVRRTATLFFALVAFNLTGIAALASASPRSTITQAVIYGGLLIGVALLALMLVMEHLHRRSFIDTYTDEEGSQ